MTMNDKNLTEDAIKGVPEYVVRSAVDKYTNELRNHLIRFILVDKSRTKGEQKDALAAVDNVLKELKEQVFESTADKLWAFIRNV